MNYLKLKQKIYEAIERNPLDRSAYEEMFAVCREYEKIDFQTAHAWNHELRNHISWGLRMTVSCQKFDEAREFDDLMFRSLLFGAQHFFDDYLQAVEYGKPLDKKFYQPRRHYLRRYVDAYQEILDGKLDFLSISMPKRAGKSQLGINFTNMLSGKYPDRATLMEGTGDDLVKSFYLGCLEYLTLPSDYHFYDIFPESKLVQTNADTKIINLLHKSRFPTVMCRSIDARQVGLSEATNLLYLDDCVEGREEAKNRQRLDDKWEVISGDIIGRAIEGTPIVICGTRYSLYDPIGHLQEEMQKQGKRCKIIETPALDLVTDESNFEYMREGRKVFTTQYFRDQREMKDGICTAIGVVGSVIASLFGGWDAALVTLVIFMAIDYVTGLLVAGVFHNSGKTENGALESRAGWKGLCRKCITLLMVLVATRLDLVTGTNFIRDAVVIAFIANETISIVENAGLMGINIPPAITSAIEVLKKKSDSVDNTDQ